MVWFQCEDCGEEIKKPKLPNHFRICSAGKLSCLDCGVSFTQETMQGHTKCITEAEKYGPKSEAKCPFSAQSKPEKAKKNADVDIHVGLSSHAPWFCSLCNAKATSRQTLLAHADGKKHRAKARAYHAAHNQTACVAEQPQTKDGSCDARSKEADGSNGIKKPDDKISTKDNSFVAEVEDDGKESKKRKHNAPTDGDDQKKVGQADTNGEVIQVDPSMDSHKSSKKQKPVDSASQNGHAVGRDGHAAENPRKRIKWKKLVTKTLRLNTDGVMKLKKLQKLVIEAIKELGVSDDEAQLQEKLLEKVNSSSRFVIEGKCIRFAAKGVSS